MEIKWAAGNGNEPESLSQKRPSSMAHLGSLRKNVRGCDCGAERTGGIFANPADMINAARRTTGDFARAIEFDVRRQVVRKINFVSVGQMIFQSELVCGDVYLTKVVDASIAIKSRPFSSIHTIWYCNQSEQCKKAKDYAPKNIVRFERRIFLRLTHAIH